MTAEAQHACRSCDHTDLPLILSLGRTPLANALLSAEELNVPEETYPLDLVFCPQCSLLQLTETVPPDKLFREYLYLSSFSETVLENAKSVAERMTAQQGLDSDSLVLEIASNDDYLLQNYHRRGIPVLGVEPARDIACIARDRGIPTVCEFFDEALAQRLSEQGQSADVIHANNVLAHVADLHGVVAGLAKLLKPDGVAHGGSLIFYASLCKSMDKGRVIGIDIEIRPHNRRAIEECDSHSAHKRHSGESRNPVFSITLDPGFRRGDGL